MEALRLPDKTVLRDLFKDLIPVLAADRQAPAADGDGSAFDGRYPGYRDDIGFMDANELSRGQLLLQSLHRDVHHMLFCRGDDADIFPQGLRVEDIFQRKKDQLCSVTDEEGSFFPIGPDFLPGLQQFSRLIDGLQEAVEGKRLQEIVDGVELEGVQGIFPESRGEDDKGRRRQVLQQTDTRDVRELDIEEEEIDGPVV